VLAVADCELVGRQVGIATATDEVGAISVVVSVKPARNGQVTCYDVLQRT